MTGMAIPAVVVAAAVLIVRTAGARGGLLLPAA